MKQRQCLVLKGDSDWCRLSLLALQSEFANERVICLSNHLLLDTVLTIPHKNAQSQLGKEFDLVIFDVAEQIDLDSLGAIMGTIRAGGALVLVISKNIKSKYFHHNIQSLNIKIRLNDYMFYFNDFTQNTY